MTKPIIAITSNFGDKGSELAKGYYQSVLAAGGSPIIIPPYTDKAALESMLDTIDGIILSGGADVNPILFGQEPIPQLHGINAERDQAEIALIRRAYERQIPMLGICRGMQLMAQVLGGDIYQDLAAQYPNPDTLIKHSQDLARERASHTVAIHRDTLLSEIMSQSTTLAVNSFHHQAVKTTGPHFRIAAQSPDHVIEAYESCEYKSILGIQWHPECFIMAGDQTMMPIFEWLISQAANYAEAKRLHSHILSLDSHCDTPMKFDTDEERLVTWPRMRDGHLDASIMVAYIPQGDRSPEAHRAATAKADNILSQIEQHVEQDSDQVGIAYTPEDLYRLKQQGRRAVMLGIENGYAIGHDLSLVEHFRSRGVVYMTLCHNGDNDICDSARNSHDEHHGVSPFGAEVIQEMNRLGMIVDLSHASVNSFYDALDISTTPIVCSHSSCKRLCPHPRNLDDQQMKALAHRGGVMQVTFYEGFLNSTPSQASILDAIEHLNHAVSVMGIEHVGIGTDFDGDGGVRGIAHAGELINFTRRLLRQRYTWEDIRLLWGENFLRVMREVQNT